MRYVVQVTTTDTATGDLPTVRYVVHVATEAEAEVLVASACNAIKAKEVAAHKVAADGALIDLEDWPVTITHRLTGVRTYTFTKLAEREGAFPTRRWLRAKLAHLRAEFPTAIITTKEKP